jgi:hypothetical protein
MRGLLAHRGGPAGASFDSGAPLVTAWCENPPQLGVLSPYTLMRRVTHVSYRESLRKSGAEYAATSEPDELVVRAAFEKRVK